MNEQFELVIGLEVHIQLNTQSKMFCGCSNVADDSRPNTTVCPVCFGMPGMLPVANKEAIRKTFLLGLALGANLADAWNFERKNYFYPDLPKGYQITSATRPPIIGGKLEFRDSESGEVHSVHIHHIHLEEDAGKLIHGQDGHSLVDLNRAGTPLIELVSEPDLRSARQAKLFLQEMKALVRALGISDADMEKGHLRCDANVSVHKKDEPYGNKVEVKNMNSFSMVEKAITHEEKRQIEEIVAGKSIAQETRSWDETKAVTVSMRSKEDVQDYRYIPEPDIPPIERKLVPEFSDEQLRKELPELPNQTRQRLQNNDTYALSEANIETCIENPDFSAFVVASIDQAKAYATSNPEQHTTALRILFGDVNRIASEHSISFSSAKLTSKDMAEIIEMIHTGKLTNQLLKSNLLQLLNGEKTLAALIKEASDADEIDIPTIVATVLNEHASVVAEWRAGNKKVYGFLVGQVMAKTKGQANPKVVNEILMRALS